MIATASPRNRRAGGARAWIVARRGFRGFRFRAFRGFRGRPATATAQRLPFHDSFMPAAPEARRRAARASAAARRARSATGGGAARPVSQRVQNMTAVKSEGLKRRSTNPLYTFIRAPKMKMQLVNAEKISSVSRMYFDMYVTASNTRKTHLSGSFSLLAGRPQGCGGSGVMVGSEISKFNILFRHEFRHCRLIFGKCLPVATDMRVKNKKIDLKFRTRAKTKRNHEGSQHSFTKSTNNCATEK